jgi:rhamnosyltransferase
MCSALKSTSHVTFGLAIPTLNAGQRWTDCLGAIERQSLQPHRRLVVDSASSDDTVARALAAGFEVSRIARKDFNHGGTRQWAARYLEGCDVVVFLTQDAILASPAALSEIVSSFTDPVVAVAYGRQLPHKWATPIEAHARLFNYGDVSIKKDASATPTLGTKVFFCSNSFAAYRRSTLLQLGGFRDDLILEEDAEYAARAIKAGFVNLYCASAPVYHSHDYTLVQQFKRYFDLGAFDARNPWMREQFGSHSGEGLRFVRSEFSYLIRRAPWLIPRAWAHTAAKLAGYRAGRLERWVSPAVKRHLSMTRDYWRSS